MNQPWTDYLGEHDRAVLARGRFAQHARKARTLLAHLGGNLRRLGL